jgi:hypothetical protein
MKASDNEKSIKSIIKSPNSSPTYSSGYSSSQKKVKFIGGTLYFIREPSSKNTENSAFLNPIINKALNIGFLKENIKNGEKVISFKKQSAPIHHKRLLLREDLNGINLSALRGNN